MNPRDKVTRQPPKGALSHRMVTSAILGLAIGVSLGVIMSLGG